MLSWNLSKQQPHRKGDISTYLSNSMDTILAGDAGPAEIEEILQDHHDLDLELTNSAA